MAAGYYSDRGFLYRDLGEENSLGNAYAIISLYTIFYLMLLNHAKKIPTVLFLALAVFVVFVLAMSGTRKAFGAGVLLMVFWGWSLLDMKRIWSWILVVVFVWGGLWGYNYVEENTYMGHRMEYLEEQRNEVLLPPEAPEILHLFGDRAPHYYYGWKIFLSHPLFGIGPLQAHVQDIYIHSEYVAQLADNGIIGFALFFLLYYWVIRELIKRNRNDKGFARCMLGGLVSTLFLFLTTWGWEFPQYFICLGVLVGYCKNGYDANLIDQEQIQ
jgi:O-antigen ligase